MSVVLRRPLFDAIEDERVRESIQWNYEYLIAQAILLSNFQFLTITVTTAVTALAMPHNLGFRPLDILLTSISNGQTVTFLYDNFTEENVVFTTTGPCTIRFFGGSYGV
jgi:hypothetical protein